MSHDDDVVMVEAGGPSGGEPLVTSGPDDVAFVDLPSTGFLKRSSTTAKKTGGLFGSLFGGGSKQRRNSDAERSRPKSSYRDEKMLDAYDDSLPIRSKDKGKRRSLRPAAPDREGFITEAEGITATETDAEAEARRAERRSKRDAKEAAARDAEAADRLEREERRRQRREQEKADLEANRSKQRDRVRKEQEAEDQRREEKRLRRAAREEPGGRILDEPTMTPEAKARQEERRRLRAQLQAEAAAAKGGGDDSRDYRKGKYAADEDDHRPRRDDKKSGSRTKDKSSSKRQSTAVMEEYYNTRNGSGTSQPTPPDKISSWVHSQAEDPPDVPPVQETILDGEKPRGLAGEDLTGHDLPRRSNKKNPRRESRYGAAEVEEEDARRTKRKTTRYPGERDRDSAGSAGAADDNTNNNKYYTARRTPTSSRRTRDREGVTEEYDAYADGTGPAPPVKTFDGKPAVGSKRNSFFGKLGGFI